MTTDAAFGRLRAANPVAVATVADADALFDRITSTAPERPLRRPSRRRRRLLVAAVALVLAAVVASTAPAISNWIGDVIGQSEVTSEYGDSQSRLTLPPGYDWPKLSFPSNSVASRGAGGSYAVMIAQAAWECYWVQEIRAGNVAHQRRAHAALRDLLANHIVITPEGASENWAPPQSVRTPTASYADDGGYEYKERMYAEAAAGHPRQLAQSCRANAPAGWEK
jgi:hypothetical protein